MVYGNNSLYHQPKKMLNIVYYTNKLEAHPVIHKQFVFTRVLEPYVKLKSYQCKSYTINPLEH
jgi:hypothetical protein